MLKIEKDVTCESTGKTWRRSFFSVFALPSNSHVTLGTERPVMVAGILNGVPTRIHSSS